MCLCAVVLFGRMYQAITAQHVVCPQYTTQAACQAMPASARMHCSWDSLNSRCMADPDASLLMPLSCPGSKARSYMNCGRRGHINACRTDTECVLGKQNRCFPAWLVSEARAKNTTEQAVAEATALAILKGGLLSHAYATQHLLVAIALHAWARRLLSCCCVTFA